ncbi:MAG: hypothetical protein PVF17_09720 [Ignavibacteria bacterium]|jgi:hypothetical protein
MINFDAYMLLSEILSIMGIEEKVIEINESIEKKVAFLRKIYKDWEVNKESKKVIEKERNQLAMALIGGFITANIYKAKKPLKEFMIISLEINEEEFNNLSGSEIIDKFKDIISDALPKILKEKVNSALKNQESSLKKTL